MACREQGWQQDAAPSPAGAAATASKHAHCTIRASNALLVAVLDTTIANSTSTCWIAKPSFVGYTFFARERQ
jgi:hypothetical protein